MATLQDGGVPRKLNREWLDNFRRLVSAGVPPLHAAQILNVHASTFYEWLKHAENKNDPNVHESIRELRDIIETGKSESIAFLILKAREQIKSTGDALRLLEKIAPEEFGNRQSSNVNITVNQMIIGIVQNMSERQKKIAAEIGVEDAEYEELDFGGDD